MIEKWRKLKFWTDAQLKAEIARLEQQAAVMVDTFQNPDPVLRRMRELSDELQRRR